MTRSGNGVPRLRRTTTATANSAANQEATDTGGIALSFRAMEHRLNDLVVAAPDFRKGDRLRIPEAILSAGLTQAAVMQLSHTHGIIGGLYP